MDTITPNTKEVVVIPNIASHSVMGCPPYKWNS